MMKRLVFLVFIFCLSIFGAEAITQLNIQDTNGTTLEAYPRALKFSATGATPGVTVASSSGVATVTIPNFNILLASKDTDDLSEGSTNVYFTNERAEDAIGSMVTGNTETGITVTYQDSDGTLDFVTADTSPTNEIQNLFETFATTSGTSPVADSATDTLTFTAGSGITITGDSSTDTITIAATGALDLDDLSDVTTDATSVLIGSSSYDDDGSNYNTVVGIDSGNSITSGINNSFLGANAGEDVTSGGDNTFIGRFAGNSISLASYNTAIGSHALKNGSGATSFNTVVGSSAGVNIATGTYNTAYGASSMSNVQSGTYNTAVGYIALAGNTGTITPDRTTAIGQGTLRNIETGDNNIALGYQAGNNVTTGSNNIIIGYDIEAPSATGSNQLVIATNIYGDTSSGNTGIGANVTTEKLNVEGAIALDEITAPSNTSGYGKIYVKSSDSLLYFKDDGGTEYDLTAGGGAGASDINGLSDGVTANTTSHFLGTSAGSAVTTGTNNACFGYQACEDLTTGIQNVAVGAGALANITTSGAESNTAVGYLALNSIVASGGLNTAIGKDAGRTTLGDENTFVGAQAGEGVTTGLRNTAIGTNALIGLTSITGDDNTCIGRSSCGSLRSTASDNVMVGMDAGVLASTGSSNILIGYQAGDNITTGSSNLIIGTSIDATSATGSNQLNIGGVILGNTSTGYVSFSNTAVNTSEVDDGNSSTADTIDWGAGNKHKSTLTDNVTYTFTAPASGVGNFLLKLIQDGTGSRTATWPASVKWPGGTAPVLSTAASSIDIVTCYYDGTNYYCAAGLDFQ